jgi:GT2 family glycosyltransferase
VTSSTLLALAPFETHQLEQQSNFSAPSGFRVAAIEKYIHHLDGPRRVIHPDPAISVSLEPIVPFSGGWCRFEICFPPDGVVDIVVKVQCAGENQVWYRLAAIDRNSFVATVRIPSPVERVTLHISGSGYLMTPLKFVLKRVGAITSVAEIARRALYVAKRRRFGLLKSAANFARLLTYPEAIVIGGPDLSKREELPFDTWRRKFDEVPEKHRPRQAERLRSLTNMPLISCLTTIASLDDLVVERLAQGMKTQIYPRWELIIATAEGLASSAIQALLLKGLDRHSFRIVVARSDVSSTLNTLLKEANGEYVLQIPEGALVCANALLEFAMTLALHPKAELVYSDEDRIDDDGRRRDPSFKPAWSPDFFAVYDYIGHLALLRRETALAIGGWRRLVSTAMDHDLKMRITDHVDSQKIIHLAKVLVSRPSSGQKESDGQAALEQMLRDHIKRRHLTADVIWREEVALPRLRYRAPETPPTVSIIIPTRDHADLLETCVRSILTKTGYSSIEVLVVDNGSVEDATHRLFSKLRSNAAIRILPSPGSFNYSALNNMAAREAQGTILGFLNNDIEVIDGNWLEEMVAHVVRPEVGCVGAKLLYPDRRVQHAGVYLGIGKLAAHGYRLAAADIPGQLNRMLTVQNVSAVTAACMLIRKAVFDEIGGFDEKELKVALSDIDLCLKVGAAGYLNLWTPFAELIHHESTSRGHDTTPAKAKRLADERRILCARWGAQLIFDPYYSPNLTYDHEDFSVRVH